jgi:hypothetical protein
VVSVTPGINIVQQFEEEIAEKNKVHLIRIFTYCNVIQVEVFLSSKR